MSDSAVNDTKMQWYVIHAYSGFEFYVMEALQKRIKLKKMEKLFGKIMVPKEKVMEMRR